MEFAPLALLALPVGGIALAKAKQLKNHDDLGNKE